MSEDTKVTVMAVVRKGSGMTQTQMAYHCNTHQPMISRYEKGLELPPATMQTTIAKILGWKFDPSKLFELYEGPQQLMAS